MTYPWLPAAPWQSWDQNPDLPDSDVSTGITVSKCIRVIAGSMVPFLQMYKIDCLREIITNISFPPRVYIMNIHTVQRIIINIHVASTTLKNPSSLILLKPLHNLVLAFFPLQG